MLDQSELHGGSVPKTSHAPAGAWSRTLYPSASDRDEHAPCVCFHLAVEGFNNPSELHHSGSVPKANTCRMMPGRGGKRSAPECRQQRRARTLSANSPHMITDEHAPSDRLLLAQKSSLAPWSSKHAAPASQRQRRARTLSPPPPRIKEQSQACRRRDTSRHIQFHSVHHVDGQSWLPMHAYVHTAAQVM